VPFCRVRCGYCDFNTYTATELGAGPGQSSASQAAYPELIAREVDLAAKVLPATGTPVSTVFFGGGTPTLLAPERLGGIIRKIDESFGLADDVEVTVEANPETVGPAELEKLRAWGVTRLSFGMQSAVPHVLRVLDRQHQPGRPLDCVRWARAAGFAQAAVVMAIRQASVSVTREQSPIWGGPSRGTPPAPPAWCRRALYRATIGAR